MSQYFDLTTADQCNAQELFSFYEDASMDFFPETPAAKAPTVNPVAAAAAAPNPKSIIKRTGIFRNLAFGRKRKAVTFRDPLCQVRLYDKVAAKRQQWGHATKFARVKRFCWDNQDDVATNIARDQQTLNRWLPNTQDQDYRLMMWRDMEKRRQNRRRRVNGDHLAYLVQALEISPACVEHITSKGYVRGTVV